MDLKGKRVAIFVDTMYQEMELWYPLYRLQEAGAEVVVIGAKAGQAYTSKLGYPCTSQKSYDDVNAKDFDGLIIPGGYAPDHMRRHAMALEFVRDLNKQGKLIAAICHAAWVLCSTPEVLRGRRATSFFAIKDDLMNAGAKWEDSEVVVDGNLVTSRKPDDLPAFCRACVEALSHAAVTA